MKEMREKYNKTQEDLADYLKIKRQTYSAYERNVSIPDSISLSKIADYFNVSTDYILGRTDNPNTLRVAETSGKYVIGIVEDLTKEEKKEIEKYKEFLRSKRDK